MKRIKEIFAKEDSIPMLIVFLGIFTTIYDFVEPTLSKITESEEFLTKEDFLILILNGIWTFVFLALLVIVIKRAVGKDIRKLDKDKDERELLHDYLVAKSGYTILMAGLCVYAFFLSGETMRDYFILVLIGLALIVRIVKREKLEKEY